MGEIFLVLLMLVVCFGLMIVVTTFLTKRAMGQVIRIMRYFGAIDPATAKTTTELGLNPPTLRDRLMRMRDYKPKALSFLANLKIINTTEDGRLYLSEDNLMSSDLVKRWPSLGKKK